MTMSGIDGSRGAPPTAITQKIGGAVHPARPKTDQRPAAYSPSGAGVESAARPINARGTSNTAPAIGFLAQAIAQESLLFGARPTHPDQRAPVALYRQAQDDSPTTPGQQTGIDLLI